MAAAGSSNSCGAQLPAGAVGRMVDAMRDLELSRRRTAPELACHGFEALPNSGEVRDWSHLHLDLLVRIFSRLELPDLVYSGAVCMPWHLSYLAVRRFRLCSPNQSPYLVYSSRDRGSSTVTLHSLSTNKSYHFPLPDPPFRSRYVVGSSQGWLVTADDRSDLHLVNPVTGAQVALPPAQSVHGVRLSLTSGGELSGHHMQHLDLQRRYAVGAIDEEFFPAEKTRHFLYQKVVLSSDPSAGDRCIILLKHGHLNHVSFARIGDAAWTWLDTTERCDRYNDFFHSSEDNLFYAVRENGEVHSIDLNGPAPVVKVILNPLLAVNCDTHYILRAPWGDLLQIRRQYGWPDDPDDPDDYRRIMDEQHLIELGIGDESETGYSVGGRITVYKVELAEQKITQIKDLRGHTLFVGFNSTFMIRAGDFPNLSPNRVYVSDDNNEFIICDPFQGRRLTCANLEDGTLTDLSFSDSLLHWPPPVWFRPHL